jgi:hypothetical protein
MARGVASGMEYLAGMNFVHRVKNILSFSRGIHVGSLTNLGEEGSSTSRSIETAPLSFSIFIMTPTVLIADYSSMTMIISLNVIVFAF